MKKTRKLTYKILFSPLLSIGVVIIALLTLWATIRFLLYLYTETMKAPFDFALLLVAAVAVYVTRKELGQAERARMTQNKPNVVCYLHLIDNKDVELVIENIGNEPAYDISFDTELTNISLITSLAESSSFKAFEKGVKFLSPSQVHRLYLGVGTELALETEWFHDQKIVIHFQHKDFSSDVLVLKQMENAIVLDFDLCRSIIESESSKNQEKKNLSLV